MSATTPNKELEELKKIVADTKRELEHEKQEREREKRELEHEKQERQREKRDLESKKQELECKERELELEERVLEQLRSSLIDLLPRSLPAQTDDQGTGQPPSNNEISLSME
uniref:Uncharacterized protein n=1 Tax=Populus alba TaxID=43335 RepID=A0A4U5PYH0_POPAL|nr:hypothetical protein D5086_0000161400 [Populus alba]